MTQIVERDSESRSLSYGMCHSIISGLKGNQIQFEMNKIPVMEVGITDVPTVLAKYTELKRSY